MMCATATGSKRCSQKYRPDTVFHAAALKHVPLVEANPLEAIKTNVLGTRNVADAALANEATAFVMISTDKAVNPTNIMGATKRAAEAYCQALDMISREDALQDRPLRQCARLERIGRAALPGADRRRRTGDGHASRHRALFHDHPGGGAAGAATRRRMRWRARRSAARSWCSTWASRSASSTLPSA